MVEHASHAVEEDYDFLVAGGYSWRGNADFEIVGPQDMGFRLRLDGDGDVE